MTAYIVAQLEIHDRETHAKYEEGFMAVFEPFDGKPLHREAARTSQAILVKGFEPESAD